MQRLENKPVVLYAEDDLDDFETMKEALDQLSDDLSLMHAKNGVEAVSMMETGSQQPALVILDLNMPLMDGKEVLVWMKGHQNFKDVPVMVFTTSSREEDVKVCQQHGCTFYRKPTLYRDLLHVAQAILDLSHHKAV